ncbi:hypothetical protein B4113_0446 [Geobacillus sp. B4113_201601]|nr:hypothetical protein B4113_0446 [Geobacillus sp. B4113_201601]
MIDQKRQLSNDKNAKISFTEKRTLGNMVDAAIPLATSYTSSS